MAQSEIIIGYDVYNSVAQYREVMLFMDMSKRAQNQQLRTALYEEMKYWRLFEADFTSYLAKIAYLNYWGGTLAGLASHFAINEAIKTRIADQQNLYHLLFNQSKLKKELNLKQTVEVFKQSLATALDSVYLDNHADIYDAEHDSMYVSDITDAKTFRLNVKNSFIKWLEAREKLGLAAHMPGHPNGSDWSRITAHFINELSELTINTSTYYQ